MRGGTLFTSLEIDDGLFSRAWALSANKTKKGLVEEALKMYVQLHEQAAVRSLRGKLVWQADLDAIREERGAGSR
jgi:hypothetical protein